MNAVIYARFSSHSQREQSIEGQLKTCYKFAADNGYTVIGEYIDRAQSGTNDNRAEFQRMIADSDKHTFNAVIVYQLDRFARNRYDSAINKAKLKKNGVRVVSARENITDDASGILVEGILESMAEYYSAELSQKIHRGMSLNAQKCLSNGSNPGLGFKVAPDHTFYVDEDEAVIVREIFERYGKGETVTDIIKDLNARQIKTSLGRDFNKNSLHRLLRNKRYIGTYLYKGEETPGGMPRIVNNEVFERVQSILDKNKAAPARSRGKEEYLLTTKLFCGYCHEMMTGYGGTGKSGKAYHYYACKNAKKHLCQKKVVDKKRIEDMVVATCRQMLTDSNIQRIAEAIEAVFKSEFDSSAMKRIKSAIQEADTAIENLWQALEKGQSVDTIMERINKRQEEKAELEAQLAIEAKKERIISAQEVTHFLSVLQKSNFDDPLNRRAVINIFGFNVPIPPIASNSFPFVAFFLVNALKVGLIRSDNELNFLLHRTCRYDVSVVLLTEKLHIEIEAVSEISMSLLFVRLFRFGIAGFMEFSKILRICDCKAIDLRIFGHTKLFQA